MGILLVSQQVKTVRSGVGTYARILLEELCNRDLRPTVATWRDEKDARSFPAVGWIDVGRRPRWDPTPGAFWTLGKRVAGLGPFDVVHFLDAREAHAFRGKGRLIGTVHDDYAAHAPRQPWGLWGRARDPLRRWAYYRWLERLERRCYARFDELLANSTETAATLTGIYGLPRVRTVPLCVPPADEVPAARLAGDPALLFAGGNFYRKGLDVLLKSLPLLGGGVHLHVAGHDPARRRLEKLAPGRVTWHGRVAPERVAAMMAGADIFVMPSRREALGLVYLEAARAGTPVIAGDRGGVCDLVRDEESGLLVPAEDPEAVAVAVRRLHADADLRARCVAGARAELAARTPGRLVAATLDAYGLTPASADLKAIGCAPSATPSPA